MKTPIRQTLIVLAIIAVALNLRPALASIGPVLDAIQAAFGMSHTQASLLTTLPIFCMGAGALSLNYYRGAINTRYAVAAAMLTIVMACLARYHASSGLGLMLSAVVVGMGIAVVQTLLPSYIKASFGAGSGNVLGLYSTGIMAGAAVAAAASAGLIQGFGLQSGLAIWALPAFLALLLWGKTKPSSAAPAQASANTELPAYYDNFYRNRRALALMLFFGVGTGAYTLVLAWMPPFYTSLGWQPEQAGFLLAGITVAEVLAGVLVALCIHKLPDRRVLLVAVLLLLLVGLAGLILAPLSLAIPISIVLGLSIGALFPLSLILTADHIEEAAGAGKLMGFVQGGGYMLASLMPLLAGLIRDHFDSLNNAWWVMAAGVVLLIALSTQFSPASYPRIRL